MVTAAEIRGAMLQRWCDPEWAIMWEVAPATGFVGKTRYADAVMMSLWPSRGLELHGVEIKVSRSDWRREALDPTKAERIAAYCDRWWVHTSPGVVQDLSEMPPAWGLREFDGKGWRTLREADKTAAQPCDRGFLAALLRRADTAVRAEATRNAEQAVRDARDAISRRVDQEVESRTRSHGALLRQVKAFEEASGLSISHLYGETDAKEIGGLVKAIRESGISKSYSGLGVLLRQLREAADAIDAALKESGLTEVMPTETMNESLSRFGKKKGRAA